MKLDPSLAKRIPSSRLCYWCICSSSRLTFVPSQTGIPILVHRALPFLLFKSPSSSQCPGDRAICRCRRSRVRVEYRAEIPQFPSMNLPKVSKSIQGVGAGSVLSNSHRRTPDHSRHNCRDPTLHRTPDTFVRLCIHL